LQSHLHSIERAREREEGERERTETDESISPCNHTRPPPRPHAAPSEAAGRITHLDLTVQRLGGPFPASLLMLGGLTFM
jgi:hypothetical protein